MRQTIVDFIESGFLAQTIIMIIVWGVLGFLYAQGRQPDENLLHVGLFILGFYFRSTVSQVSKTVRN